MVKTVIEDINQKLEDNRKEKEKLVGVTKSKLAEDGKAQARQKQVEMAQRIKQQEKLHLR